MGKRCEARHAHFAGPQLIKGYLSTGESGACFSTLGCYSSDVGNIMLRHSTNAGAGGKYSMACPTTSIGLTKHVVGILAGFDSDSSNLNGVQYIAPGSTQKIYIERFDFAKEYAINFSTANSTVMPATSDIGSYVGFSSTNLSTAITAIPNHMNLSMSNIGSTLAPGSTASRMFQVTGYDTDRRKLHVIPVQDSSSFTW